MSYWDTVMDSGDVPYGKRLVPSLVDQIAVEDPERICFSFPRSSNFADGFQDLSYRTFANAVNKTAYFIHTEIGRSSCFETVLYIGYPDVRYFIVLVALIKTGHKVLFSSHSNTSARHADLIKRTDCTILLYTAGFPVSGILESCRMETLCMPELQYLLQGTAFDVYPYTKTFDQAEYDPIMVTHTSSASGQPEPVVWTNSMLAQGDAHLRVPPLNGRPALFSILQDAGRRKFSALPIYHGTGVANSLGIAVFCKGTVVIGPPGQTTAGTFDLMLDYGRINSASCEIATLEEIATRPDILRKLGQLKHITYIGAGSMSTKCGDLISQYTQLFPVIASSESSILVQHTTDREDWQYMCLNPIYNGIQMRSVYPNSELYELWFIRNPEYQQFQGIFNYFPRQQEVAMSDLYSKHPTKEHHWKHEGRPKRRSS
ncbi:hypothetical protein P154DRAFT_434088 [Amniculicola lignicola CBS 123094]|uniref:AMP-dependent synthetase/ligase domain-containing protein n=1 Tax=Amniculicola lignicola CBS 123094 TaxID=1392246 RepID=A0A6A5WLD8_9PLEO|nr:hypothetical protein P154DRAFT_434088 [Amniculicola lignicola CBS 123094]